MTWQTEDSKKNRLKARYTVEMNFTHGNSNIWFMDQFWVFTNCIMVYRAPSTDILAVIPQKTNGNQRLQMLGHCLWSNNIFKITNQVTSNTAQDIKKYHENPLKATQLFGEFSSNVAKNSLKRRVAAFLSITMR